MEETNETEIDYSEFFPTPEEEAAKFAKARKMRKELLERLSKDPEVMQTKNILKPPGPEDYDY